MDGERVRVRIRDFLGRVGVSLTLLVVVTSCSVYESPDGCTPKGTCPYGKGQPRNYWYQPERVAVVQPKAGPSIILHELCHGLQGLTLPADDVALAGWHDTPAGKAFPNELWCWHYEPRQFDDVRLEDAAWTCAFYYLDPSRLTPARLAWAERYLPK